ncbi:AraC family transcriptional regulator [Dysgonomonas sp. 521]|uniref:helix-turn-helix domain-containing protein n=1 Tax=Dysgonomonas sp. 521 TaxID=2302932 RepID=UPI0013D07EAD|nr:helix-turn-helix domain-containing protein [Dysgonomonas sp. 521]NDV97594.1 AraC family transcriptional regulator [Dysgonomonas sp. 521]
MNNYRLGESDYEFRVSTSNLLDMVGKTHLTTELTLMKCVSGSAIIAINSRKCTLTANHSFILLEAMEFQVFETTSDFSVICCAVSLPFYFELSARISPNVFSILLYGKPDLYNEKELRPVDLLFENLCLLFDNNKHNNRRVMAMNLIICYIYEIYELTLPYANSQKEDDKSKYYSPTIISFYNLLAVHSKKNRSIEFYADKLNISSRYLYKIVKNSLHITPKQVIDDVVVSMIKQMLLTTTLNNQEIAYKFNFPDQSSFGQYFRRCTGMSPIAFKNKHINS